MPGGSRQEAATRKETRGAHAALAALRRPAAIVRDIDGETDVVALTEDGRFPDTESGDVLAVLPPLWPEWLGDRSFGRVHGVRFPYAIGEMARGIATARMAVSGVRAGAMAFFGSAGLRLNDIDAAVRTIKGELGEDASGWGANLIHSPQEPSLEMATADLFIREGVRRVSASAFMKLAPAIVYLAAKGLSRDRAGVVMRRTHLFAKVSRAEVARAFLSPAPDAVLRALASAGRITAQEADLASTVPLAEDVTAEADSGGHTDNRPLAVLLPALLRLRDELADKHGYGVAPRIGAAGGLGDPSALAAAFAMGAAYVVTGSVNQCAEESGLSADARALLAAAEPTDVAMAPAADMFELGVKVQVLKRGTMFAQRGARLFEAWRRYDSFDDMPASERGELERSVLGRSIDDIWVDCVAHFASAEPAELARAERDGKHRMALVFRWYLFMGAQWAREGVRERRADYQIWCGPAMGAFNDWVKASFLEPVGARTVAQIMRNLMEGAAHVTRANQLRSAGVSAPARAFDFRPRPLA